MTWGHFRVSGQKGFHAARIWTVQCASFTIPGETFGVAIGKEVRFQKYYRDAK
jgi:hypothetical protein